MFIGIMAELQDAFSLCRDQLAAKGNVRSARCYVKLIGRGDSETCYHVQVLEAEIVGNSQSGLHEIEAVVAVRIMPDSWNVSREIYLTPPNESFQVLFSEDNDIEGLEALVEAVPGFGNALLKMLEEHIDSYSPIER